MSNIAIPRPGRPLPRRVVVLEPYTDVPLDDLRLREDFRELVLLLERTHFFTLPSPLATAVATFTLTFVDERRRCVGSWGTDSMRCFRLPARLYHEVLNVLPAAGDDFAAYVALRYALAADTFPWREFFAGLRGEDVAAELGRLRRAIDGGRARFVAGDRAHLLTENGDLANSLPFYATIGHPVGVLDAAARWLKIDAPDLATLFRCPAFRAKVARPVPVTYCLSWVGYLWHELRCDLRGGAGVRECQNPACRRLFTPREPRQHYCGSPDCARQRAAARQRARRGRAA